MTEREPPTSIWKRCCQYLIEWNVFENEDDERLISDNNLSKESIATAKAQLLQRQRFATRVYIIALILSLLILVIWTLLIYQTKVVTNYQPSFEEYQQFHKQHGSRLYCPCKTTSMPYKHFIISKVIMHQICSSDFIQQNWIDAFYIPDSSRYGSMDFRTTANSQFKLLQSLCQLAHNNIIDTLVELNNTQLLTSNALSEQTILFRTKISNEQIRQDMLAHFKNALKLIHLTTHDSRTISALNTNYILGVSLRLKFNYTSYYSYMYVNIEIGWIWTENNQTNECRCEERSCSLPAGFYSLGDIGDFNFHSSMKPQTFNVTDFVPGFVGSCTPLEAIFQANFTCLYDRKCIHRLVPYFPPLIEIFPTVRTLNTSVSSRYPLDVNVSRLVEELFIEQWNVSINYSAYYQQCSPKICTHIYVQRADFVYMITLLISLCGGLQTILRFLVPILVNYFMRKRPISDEDRRRINRNENSTCCQKLINHLKIIKHFLMNLNLFESSKRTSEAIHRQKLSTKIYLCLLIGTLFILLLFTTISQRTTSITYENISYENYKDLYNRYNEKLICPCREMIHPHSSFVNLTAIYHPICSSVFVTDLWFEQLELKKYSAYSLDWRIFSRSYFRLLSTLCEFASETIDNGLKDFNQNSIVTTQVISQILLNYQINETIEQLIRSLNTEIKRVNNILGLLFQVNQYYMQGNINGYPRIIKIDGEEDFHINILFHGPINITEGLLARPRCLCAFQNDCEEQMYIYNYRKFIPVPGFVIRCSIMESLLASTLECLYSNTDCLDQILLRYINYTSTAIPVPPLNSSKLIRTQRNSTMTTIIDYLFVEEWKTNISHENYFHNCAPEQCHYTFIQRANHLYIVTVFLAVYGGLIFSLRLLIPLFVKLGFRLRQLYRNRNNRELAERHYRLRNVYEYVLGKVRTRVIELNFFEKYSFGNNLDDNYRIKLGQLTTKFYICLYIIGLVILALYTSIEQRTITVKVYHPSLSMTEQLLENYIETTDCPCTKASIPIEEFVDIHTYFHQICESIFVNKQWRESLVVNYDEMNLFNRTKDSYRLFLPVQLQFLSGLCEQSIKHVNETIRLFLSTSFVTSRLLSQSSFNTQISNLFYQIQTNIPIEFTRALQLVHILNRDNRFVTVFESNYQMFMHENQSPNVTLILTKARTYENNSTNCSCGLQSDCVIQAAFNLPDYAIVKGLLMGCLPSNSFLASTLECFYDQDCIDLIHNRMPSDKNQTHAKALRAEYFHRSSYKINSTINELVSKLFIETWSTKISYDRYFIQCTPNTCSYSFIDNANPLYVAATLLGLYGGLTVVLSWWCPQFIDLIRRLRTYFRRNQRRRVVPSIS